MIRILALTSLVPSFLALTLMAPARAEDAGPREKISTMIVYGDDPCPRSTDEEIVVCAREPESERYRIPEKLRQPKAKADKRSWAERAQLLETVSKAGLPNSCSPIGSGGQTGCIARFLREAREQSEMDQREAGQ